jgi:3-mercaptopyruvate sulfurtransferase SseA
LLIERGLPNVSVLAGGWDRWRDLGYPVEPIAAPALAR